jgi:hypothetical protein
MADRIFETTAAHLAPGGEGGGFEPQRSFNWLLDLMIPPLGNPGYAAPDVGDMVNIRLSVEKMDFPRYGTQVITMRWMNENRKVAGAATVQQLNVTIRDFIDINTYGILNQWMENVHSARNGSIGWAARYKSQGYLNLLTPDGAERGNAVGDSGTSGILLDGVWPSELTATPLDYESDNGLVKITMTLQVDKVFGLDTIQAIEDPQLAADTDAPNSVFAP